MLPWHGEICLPNRGDYLSCFHLSVFFQLCNVTSRLCKMLQWSNIQFLQMYVPNSLPPKTDRLQLYQQILSSVSIRTEMLMSSSSSQCYCKYLNSVLLPSVALDIFPRVLGSHVSQNTCKPLQYFILNDFGPVLYVIYLYMFGNKRFLTLESCSEVCDRRD